MLDLFDQQLPTDWEIYVQPHLNGLRPDFVLLNPRVGVAVFEVKDWNLSLYDVHGDDANTSLIGRDRTGQKISLRKRDPLNKLLLYEDELFNIYCPRLDDRAGRAVITAGLIFPLSPRKDVNRLFEPLKKRHDKVARYPKYFPISSAEDVSQGNLCAVFPESKRTHSRIMTEELAEDLRGWLREPFFSRVQRKALHLDPHQRHLAMTRTATGYRRIKGAAGTGKSVILAARAATLAAEGKYTLVIGYNITLLNYLRDLAVRYVAARDTVRRQIDFLHFHGWCRRICISGEYEPDYRRLWACARDQDSGVGKDQALERAIPSLVRRIYSEHGATVYDAILVDEAQDFSLDWWQTLRLALKPGGEMVLVTDRTQNVYGKADDWTDGAMEKAGFRGPWVQLETSYRLPPAVVPLVRSFSDEFLRDEDVDPPSADRQTEVDLFPTKLRWVQIGGGVEASEVKALEACRDEVLRVMKELLHDTAVADIVCLTDSNDSGRRLVKHLAERNVNVLHTFDRRERIAQRQKRAFFQGDARIKATTVHCFKGWEGRHIVLFVKSVKSREAKTLLYTALTRLRGDRQGSSLTVVSCCSELRGFGRSWPQSEQL